MAGSEKGARFHRRLFTIEAGDQMIGSLMVYWSGMMADTVRAYHAIELRKCQAKREHVVFDKRFAKGSHRKAFRAPPPKAHPLAPVDSGR